MESQTTRRIIQQDNIHQQSEFISARTDTKIKLGYLFIQNPNKLEMYGLRQVSSPFTKFTKETPLIELPSNPVAKQLIHKSSSIENQKQNKNKSKLILNKSCQEKLILSYPNLVLEQKKEQIALHPRILQSHHSRIRKELPPILANSNVSPPPFNINQLKQEKKQKFIGKIYLGRQSKFNSKQTESDIQKNFIDQLSFESSNTKRLMKNQNLKRSKQISLSQAVKVLKKNQQVENKSNLYQLFKSKEKELISIIQGVEESCQTIDDFI